MGKFKIVDTQETFGISPWSSVCQVGIRVSDSYRFGNLSIIFDEISSARTFVNKTVLREALLANPEQTRKLLGISVKDVRKEEVDKSIKEPVKEPEVEPQEEVDKLVEEPEVMEPEEVKLPIEDLTEEIVLDIRFEKTKQELVNEAMDKGLEANMKMTKDQIIKVLEEN